ncbi:peptide-methionine (S)-S-oxide reductase [Cytobacillus oceanisediminis]|uniref:peptide-methionine (S)-S-oxide reductase n=1 Tax=Cytobacillus oceanisediminis TaxID=665099 RepID=UPI003734E294
MGCFWGPESRFGYHPGVIRTRVGYAGGKEGQPTSKNTLDTEALHIQYDSKLSGVCGLIAKSCATSSCISGRISW